MNVRSFVYSSVCSISEASQSGINCYVCFKENNEKKETTRRSMNNIEMYKAIWKYFKQARCQFQIFFRNSKEY